jgi:hypothetical protein
MQIYDGHDTKADNGTEMALGSVNCYNTWRTSFTSTGPQMLLVFESDWNRPPPGWSSYGFSATWTKG